jgi:peptide deformylase
MSVRKILQATDPRGEAVLRRKSSKVRHFDQALERLAADLVETMRAAPGVGLAAPQIGTLQRVIAVELFPQKEAVEEQGQERKPGPPLVLCNPEFSWLSEEQQVGEEGCLSLAGWYGQVARALEVEVRYQDVHGRRRKMRAAGFQARILQHEVDHLEGELFTDRLEDLATLVRVTPEGQEPVPPEEVPGTGRARQVASRPAAAGRGEARPAREKPLAGERRLIG